MPLPHMIDSRIFTTGPMSSTLRPEFLRPETEEALYQYQDMTKRGIKARAKYYGDLYQRLYREDVEAAVARFA